MSQIEKLIEWLKPGAVVYVGGSCAEPRYLLDLIAGHSGSLKELIFIQQPLGAVNQRDLSVMAASSRQRCFFMAPQLQDGLREGRIEFVPMHMRAIFDHLSSTPVDVALFQAARDKNGVLRYGPNVDYLDAVLATTKRLVIEENTSFTAPICTPAVDESRVDLIVTGEGGVPEYPSVEPDETSEVIGRYIADLIRDGDCLQTGIGAVPAAILNNLGERNDLGFHGGLMDEGVMTLIEAGNINGSRKAVDKGRHILGMALGSEKLLNWLAFSEKAQDVVFRSADYTHESSVIARLDQFVSINSALEIDLMGQVNAEVAGGRQISGTGGSVDFMRAAKMSEGGRSIVAMSSTARRGTVSRIVPSVNVVTALRTDIDMVVTEFGVAELKDQSLASRTARLIEIAHPEFRDQLREPKAG